MQTHLVLKPIQENYGVTISTTPTALPSLPTAAASALIQIETADIRARYDATSTVTGGVGGGVLMTAGTDYVVTGWDNLNRMRLRRDGATDAMINVIYNGEAQP